MLINSGTYLDYLSNTKYSISRDIPKGKVHIVTGENGVGKSRFIEGVLLKKFKKDKLRILYFSQDIENQILSFELISLVKKFVSSLRKSGTFFKAVLFNDDSHNKIDLNFNYDDVIHPNNISIKNFIIKEALNYPNVDVIIFDEVDKYFTSSDEFWTFINNNKVENKIIISHVLEDKSLIDTHSIHLSKSSEGVLVE